jgi:hypothetical protein
MLHAMCGRGGGLGSGLGRAGVGLGSGRGVGRGRGAGGRRTRRARALGSRVTPSVLGVADVRDLGIGLAVLLFARMGQT